MLNLKPYSSYDCGVFMLACSLHAAIDENLEMQFSQVMVVYDVNCDTDDDANANI